MCFWPICGRSWFTVCGRWAITAIQVDDFQASSLLFFFTKPYPENIQYPKLLFFFIPRSPHPTRNKTAMNITSRHAHRRWLNLFTCSLSRETRLANWWLSAEKEAHQIPTGHRNIPLGYSTSWKIRCIECQALCFFPNTS